VEELSVPDGFIRAENMYSIQAWRTGTATFAMGPPDEEFMFIMFEAQNVHDGTVTEFYFRAPLEYAEHIATSISGLTEE
jgi:hypothetical protein